MMGHIVRPSRRDVLKATLVAAGALGMPFVRRAAAADRSLRVSTFGGAFEQGFIEHIYPAFVAATGIRVEPVSLAAEGADAPADVAAVSQQDVARGADAGIWRPLDASRIPNLQLLDRRFIHQSGGRVDAVGGMAWYQTLVVNPAAFRSLPTSWKILWEPGRRGAWGLSSGSRSTLFEITAATWFGGNAILDTQEGIETVIAKMDELKPNVKVWWDSERSMQTAYENGDVVGGMYFNDAANQMARDGAAIASIFPEEGGVIDFGSWCQPVASTKIEEAQEFINFMSAPATQALLTRTIGTAPLVSRGLTGLSDDEFAAVSSDRAPIGLAVQARMRSANFMKREFERMLIG